MPKHLRDRLVINWRAKYLYAPILTLVLLLTASIFKNISSPLFWSDEGMTVMHGKRVLEYGYPKVHDGKNVLYDLDHSNLTLGIDKKTDAFIGGANWGQYYVAALGVVIAEISDDIYVKTGIIRSLFAFFGLAGLVLFAYLASNFFYSSLSKTVSLISFAFLELISVPLVLHLREARYYPLTVFLVALTVFAYVRYRMLNKAGYGSFLVFLTISLFLLFLTFSPPYFILLIAIFLFESLMLATRLVLKHRGSQAATSSRLVPPKALFLEYLKIMLPLLLSLIAAAPLIFFFRMFRIAEEMAKFNFSVAGMDSLQMYFMNLSLLWRYFSSSDYIYLAIILKVLLLACLSLRVWTTHVSTLDIPKTVFSSFLTILFIVYAFSIAKIPNLLFTRYFIPLQPVLALIIILDAAVISDIISRWRHAAAVFSRSVLIILCLGFVYLNISSNLENIEGHAYELFHPYKGALDYVIPFIKGKYKSTDNLVIATNYEETSFMYYLDAKVIVGYVGNNLDDDSGATPDIIAFRSKVSNKFQDLFSDFLKKGQYIKIAFPVMDLPPNNFPELNLAPPLMHRFRTLETGNEDLKVDIYLRI